MKKPSLDMRFGFLMGVLFSMLLTVIVFGNGKEVLPLCGLGVIAGIIYDFGNE